MDKLFLKLLLTVISKKILILPVIIENNSHQK